MKKGQKVLTISVAAYNVEDSLADVLDSLLIDNLDLLEVLIIDDGSSDGTAEVAKRYQNKYPHTFRLITKENGGYGSTINTGIREAKGKYFKLLDGDDRYNTKNLQRLCSELLENESDVVFTPFVMNDIVAKKKTIEKANAANRNKSKLSELSFDSSIFHMHSLAYKTSVLKKSKILIDEKCFYTDTEYVVLPLMHAKTIAMLDYPIYEYKIGAEGQSVSRQGVLKHYKDHTKMTDRLIAESKTELFSECASKTMLEKYITGIIISDIVLFKLDIFSISYGRYSTIKKRMKTIKLDRPDLYSAAKKESKTILIISMFGYIGYLFVKAARALRNRIRGANYV